MSTRDIAGSNPPDSPQQRARYLHASRWPYRPLIAIVRLLSCPAKPMTRRRRIDGSAESWCEHGTFAVFGVICLFGSERSTCIGFAL